MRSAFLLTLVGCGVENGFRAHLVDDYFYQSPDDRVDLLWVVDNSSSMGDEQESLALGFEGFVDGLDELGADFQMAVITTTVDTEEPTSVRFLGDPPILTPADDYVAAFQSRVRVGTGGDDRERGLLAATMALSDEALGGYNQGFIRTDVPLVVIVVSDEEDCSDDGLFDGYPATECYRQVNALPPVEHYLDQLYDTKITGGDVRIGAIVGTKEAACDDAYASKRYTDAAVVTRGMVGNVCESNWDDLMYDIGLAAIGIAKSWQLTETPVEGSLAVWVDGDSISANPFDGWTYDENARAIVFHGTSVPARGTEIHISYQVR